MNETSGNDRVVLLVEDNPEMREFVARALKFLGYDIIEVGDGSSALTQIKKQQNISLLLTDVMLPGGLNGAELARQARDLRPERKVLFVSGYADTAIDAEEMRRLGATMLAKPFRIRELQERLELVLGGQS